MRIQSPGVAPCHGPEPVCATRRVVPYRLTSSVSPLCPNKGYLRWHYAAKGQMMPLRRGRRVDRRRWILA